MTTPMTGAPYYPPAPPRRRPHRGLKVVLGGLILVLAFLVGVGAGSAGSASEGAAPDACLTALDKTEAALAVDADTFGRIGETFTLLGPAIDAGDTAGVVAAMTDLSAYTVEQTAAVQALADDYNAAAETCRSAG